MAIHSNQSLFILAMLVSWRPQLKQQKPIFHSENREFWEWELDQDNRCIIIDEDQLGNRSGGIMIG